MEERSRFGGDLKRSAFLVYRYGLVMRRILVMFAQQRPTCLIRHRDRKQLEGVESGVMWR
jgi:hypothetical protein